MRRAIQKRFYAGVKNLNTLPMKIGKGLISALRATSLKLPRLASRYGRHPLLRLLRLRSHPVGCTNLLIRQLPLKTKQLSSSVTKRVPLNAPKFSPYLNEPSLAERLKDTSWATGLSAGELKLESNISTEEFIKRYQNNNINNNSI